MITIDYQSRQPLYEQIASRFAELILKGVIKPDEQLPSVRSLAMELSINPNTIQKAFVLLEQQGYIYSVKGRGNFAAPSKGLFDQARDEFFKSFKELILRGRDLGIDEAQCKEYIQTIYKNGGTV